MFVAKKFVLVCLFIRKFICLFVVTFFCWLLGHLFIAGCPGWCLLDCSHYYTCLFVCFFVSKFVCLLILLPRFRTTSLRARQLVLLRLPVLLLALGIVHFKFLSLTLIFMHYHIDVPSPYVDCCLGAQITITKLDQPARLTIS